MRIIYISNSLGTRNRLLTFSQKENCICSFFKSVKCRKPSDLPLKCHRKSSNVLGHSFKGFYDNLFELFTRGNSGSACSDFTGVQWSTDKGVLTVDVFPPLRHNGGCVGVAHITELYKLSTNKHLSTIIQGPSSWIHMNNVCVKIDWARTSLWAELVRTDNGWYLCIIWPCANRSVPDLQHNPHLPSNSCLLWPRQSLRRTETHSWGATDIWAGWTIFGFITEQQIIDFICIDSWHPLSLTLSHVGVCFTTAAVRSLIRPSLFHWENTHIHTYILISSNEVRSLSAPPQLIIFPAPETMKESPGF